MEQLSAARTRGVTVDPATVAPRVVRGAWLIVLVVGLILFELVRWAVQSTANADLVPSLLLLGAVVVPLSFATFLYGLPTTFEVGGLALVVMAVVGGVVGVMASGILEYDTLRHLSIGAMVGVAFIEESAKLLGPAAALLIVRPIRPANGLILGVACGAGFAVLETLGYSSVALIQSHEHLGAVDALLFQRGLFSPATHMAWTGFTACALWAAAEQHWSRRSVGIFLMTFLVAVALHATWDYTNALVSYVLLGAASLSLLTVAVRSTRAPEASPQPAADGPPKR
jgi:RsiW-degrading membrane proteinase PrsW (M82 family)